MDNYNDASLIITPNGVKAGKLYALKGADLDVVRATSATRVNASGLIETVGANVPRLDYTNGTCPSILVEPQRTNVFKNSEDFSNASFYKVNTTITTNSIVSPDGNTTADLCSYTSSTNVLSTQGINSNNSDYTISIFAKKGTGNILRIRETFYFGIGTVFNLDLGTVISGAGKIENYGNGWYRCSISKSYLNTQTIMEWSFDSNENINNLYLWGVQCEAGSYATSYIPTTSASVTRNADVISKTGISGLIGQTEGVIFVDANISTRSNTRVLLDVQDGTNNDTFQFVLGGNTLTVNIYDGGNIQALFNGGYCLGRKKIALGYKANDFVLYIDGVQVATDTNGTVPTASLMALGYLYIASGYELGDTINSLALWKTRLSNTELATLTTI